MTSYNSLTKIVEYYGRSKTVAPVALSAASPMTRFAVESGEHGCVLPNIRVRCRLDNAELYSKEETMRGYTANFEDNIFLKHSAASQSSLYADDFDTNKEDDLMDIGEGEGTLPSSVDAEKKRDTVSSYTSNKEPVTVTIGDDSCGADQQLHEDFEINDDFVGFCKKKATPETKDLETNTLTETTAPVEKEADATTVEEEDDPFASTINDEESPGLYRRITLYGNNTNRLPEILPYSEWWFRRGPVALPVVVIAVGLTGTVHLYEMDLLRYLRSSVQLNCSTISTLLMNDGEGDVSYAEAAGRAGPAAGLRPRRLRSV
ncbi:hypothetical protein ADEAN_001023100 [Angomonas deanei]|uniref:Uncharacterized protein n=1 Tax=Angomonas deanei TaxID=59799 RepID=A0A7G2CUQ5_9TRYP|nr:hypothetical protein ADEAN_001023100 [Angomonas deanei]